MNINPMVAVFNGGKTGSAATRLVVDMAASDPLLVEA
jgi:hypothetical protein